MVELRVETSAENNYISPMRRTSSPLNPAGDTSTGNESEGRQDNDRAGDDSIALALIRMEKPCSSIKQRISSSTAHALEGCELPCIGPRRSATLGRGILID